MTEAKRRAIVWDLIEQLAFRPWKKKDWWLRRYSNQLNNLLQLQPIWIKGGSQGCFQIAELEIACEYKIESENTYIASFKKTEKKIWSVHADAAYLSKAALHVAEATYPEEEIDTHLRSDIANVLEGMLFHPRNHSHLSEFDISTAEDIEPGCGGLKGEEIRITGAAYNGFIFLYHIAYQLCVVSKEAREAEKARLIDLFENAIRNNQNVNAGALFNFK